MELNMDALTFTVDTLMQQTLWRIAMQWAPGLIGRCFDLDALVVGCLDQPPPPPPPGTCRHESGQTQKNSEKIQVPKTSFKTQVSHLMPVFSKNEPVPGKSGTDALVSERFRCPGPVKESRCCWIQSVCQQVLMDSAQCYPPPPPMHFEISTDLHRSCWP